MRGYHANSYYHSTWGPGNFLFTYLLLSSFTGPRYVYVTDVYRADTIRGQRDAYRHSYTYKKSGFEEQQVLQHPEGLRRVELRLGRPEPQQRPTVLPVTRSLNRILQGQYDRRAKQLGNEWRTRSGFSSGRGLGSSAAAVVDRLY